MHPSPHISPIFYCGRRCTAPSCIFSHREVAERNRTEIDGCIGIHLETWDRLSHDHRRSFLFALNQGNLLVVRMEMGRYADMAPAYETLLSSLKIRSAPALR